MSLRVGTNFSLKSFKWLEESTVSDLNQNKDLIMDLDPEGDTMYVFEVDGEYPEHLHDSHNDYPMAIESKLLTEDQLSPYNRGLLASIYIPKEDGLLES